MSTVIDNPSSDNQWHSAAFIRHVERALDEDAAMETNMGRDAMRAAYLQAWLAFAWPAGNC